MSKKLAKATLGAGCFWCVEAVYLELKGVNEVVSGYTGGAVQDPSYQQVCTGMTGHAEVVQITFDPAVISFSEILYVFWRTHDPTTLNRQGADVGTQYRSVIYYHNEEQRTVAENSKREADAAGLWKNPIVTEIAPAVEFYAAEEYHQDYYALNPHQPYCQIVINPKLKKFRKEFGSKLKDVN
ncbi:MAG: peptide-methionine (S)-S-oxide reductase MsrA [Candidatus Poribacteria bacterium]|nr:peptide-methionine (S)-S-oxide reductase MsrA [Candidatus Poribacteria bacterium]MDE0504959.1 peptide-methionine (S)-S-oxide reductase MsrA [Candidatus Poribacteria bacterium]